MVPQSPDDAPHAGPPLNVDVPTWRKAALILLAAVGLYYYAKYTVHWPVRRLHDVMGAVQPMFAVSVVALLMALPLIHRPAARWLDRLRRPKLLGRRITTLLVWLIATAYLAFTAWHQGRDFFFKTQDEFMYLVQLQAVAHGHLWMPQHPLADFFQEFYMFVRPVTAGMYFPGTAILFAPAVWLHIPLAIWALIISGGVVAMTYRVTSELLNDAVAGLLAALLLVALTEFRTLSLETVSYIPFGLLALSMWWAYLHWRRGQSYRWAAAIGALAGLSAITRPLDAIVFFLPLFCLMVGDYLPRPTAFAPSPGTPGEGWGGGLSIPNRKSEIANSNAPHPGPPPEYGKRGKIGRSLVILTLAAAPFLSMQLALDKAVSGHALKTPVQEYQDHFWPGTVGGLRPHVLRGIHRPDTPLAQFQDDYDHFVLPHFRGKTRELTETYTKVIQYALPHYLMFVPLMMSVMALSDRRRFAFLVILLLFPTAYLAWVMFNKPYAVVVAPIMMFGIAAGGQALIETFPRWRAFLGPWFALSVAVIAVRSLPEFGKDDKTTGSIVMTTYNRLSQTIHRPAIVFFRYHAEVPGMWKHEQTYNVEAAWFDDEPIIRAHDLGNRDAELLNYYAARQPGRTVYLFDQKTMRLTEFGNVKELADHPAAFRAKLAAVPTTMPATQPAPVAPHRPRKSRGR